jgi:hypothetical protein
MHRRPAFARIASALLGLACGLLGAEMTFGSLRPDEPRSDAVLYSIEVRNGAGDLLASPMLVGEEGRPVHLSLETAPSTSAWRPSRGDTVSGWRCRSTSILLATATIFASGTASPWMTGSPIPAGWASPTGRCARSS